MRPSLFHFPAHPLRISLRFAYVAIDFKGWAFEIGLYGLPYLRLLVEFFFFRILLFFLVCFFLYNSFNFYSFLQRVWFFYLKYLYLLLFKSRWFFLLLVKATFRILTSKMGFFYFHLRNFFREKAILNVFERFRWKTKMKFNPEKDPWYRWKENALD